MALSETQSRCVGRTDLSPEGPVCPKRETCQRYTDLRDRGGDYAWPKHISVFTHVCSDPELSQFIAVEVVGHERNSAPAPDMGESLPSIPQRGVFLATESASSMGGNTVSWGES